MKFSSATPVFPSVTPAQAQAQSEVRGANPGMTGPRPAPG